MDLPGKTALVTGAARRIGREIALTLARRGADIVVHYRDSAAEARALAAEIRRTGREAYLLKADFSGRSIETRVRRSVSTLYRLVPRVDILVNNAAIFYPSEFGRIREKDWDDFMTVNLKAPFFLAQAIGMRMLRQKSGKIVNLADWTGLRPYTRYLPYCVSKAGLISATLGLAKLLAPWVQVAAVAPGPILAAAGMSRAETKKAAERTLLKRFGSPRDIAQTVRFFVEDTDFVTGAVLPVEGGALLA